MRGKQGALTIHIRARAKKRGKGKREKGEEKGGRKKKGGRKLV
jgi:hypothetical protein